MCYYLYGATDNTINREDYDLALKKSQYKFNIGTKHDVKMDIVNKTFNFRVTNNVCDCDFPVGEKSTDPIELTELAALITDLRDCRDSKHIYISKAWAGRKKKSEKNININDMDIVSFLSNMELNCLYRIDLH